MLKGRHTMLRKGVRYDQVKVNYLEMWMKVELYKGLCDTKGFWNKEKREWEDKGDCWKCGWN